MRTEKIRVGISQGDMNGIGYEVMMKALSDPRLAEEYTIVIFGSPKVLAFYRKLLNLNNFTVNTIRSASEADPRRINLVNCLDDAVRVDPGKSTPEAGAAAFLCLKEAVTALKQEQIDVLVTAPINKQNVQSDAFHFPGHTEYLQSTFGADDSLMLMVSEGIRIAVLTGHIPLSEVASAISREKIVGRIRLLNQTLLQDFSIKRGKIAVLGLNPHSGDGGLLGNEEEEILIPAIEQAKEEGYLVFGPYAADGFFGSDHISKFDAVLAMYHDQGLIPFKLLAFESGVNFTAGLPYVRTSPAHGTAYDLAGTGLAQPDSFRNAIYTAVDIFRNREAYREWTRNKMAEPEGKKQLHNSIQ